ncbi:MAG: PHP domain-containing protein [Christensenellales bacterium]
MMYYTLDRAGQFYRGNLHTHSTISDGEATPAQLRALYEREGYSFIAITDHRIYGIHEELGDDKFLVMPGVELDTVYDGVVHHIVGVGAPETAVFPHGHRFSHDVCGGVDPQVMIDHLTQNNNIAIYAHPYWSYAEMKDIAHLRNLTGMEIINFSCEQTWKSGMAEPFYEYFWKYGNRIWCFGSDDAHGHSPDYCGGYITVKCGELTHDAVLSAIRAGSFYASYSAGPGQRAPEIYDFTVEDGVARITCSPCRSIYINVSRSIYFPTHGTPASPVTYAEKKLPAEAAFVKAICTDFNGRVSWTQPVALE